MPIHRLPRILSCALLAAASLHASANGGAPCSLQKLAVAPAAPGAYLGRAGGLDVVLKDDRPNSEVQAFPETAIELRRPAAKAACSVPGGVWVREDLFVSTDGRTLMVHESSGSSDVLVFVDTRDCRRVGEVDVSDASWRLRDRSVHIEPLGGKPSIRRLDATCRPSKPKN